MRSPLTHAAFVDLDGTLVHLNPPPSELEQLRCDLLALASSAGIRPPHRGIFRVYEHLVEQCGIASSVVREARRCLDAAEVRWAGSSAVSLLEGSELTALRDAGVALALVTNNGIACVEELNRVALLPDEFDVRVTRDDVTSIKPSPEPLHEAARRIESFASSLQALWFVGDGANDSAAVEAFNATSSIHASMLLVDPPNSTVASSVASVLRKLR